MKTKDKVYNILRDLSGCDDIKEDFSLLGDLGLDSLEMVTLLIKIEDVFEIELRESDMNPLDLKTASDVSTMVGKYIGGTDEKVG